MVLWKGWKILCVTRNAPKDLDGAMIRAGRVDYEVHFGHATEEAIVQLFMHLYTTRPDEMVAYEMSVSDQHDDLENLA
jgi:ATP-dependent 26S proteasome regulatory subunit